MIDLILDPREFRILDRLRLVPRKSFTGKIRGERLTKKKGISIDFSDYRDYVDGDDLRHMDWNVLARLDTPIVKTYQDEEDLAVHLILDASLSMDFGQPNKLDFAIKLACAFGYIGLCSGDAIYPLATTSVRKSSALRGRGQYNRLAIWANNIDRTGKVGISKTLRSFAQSSARPGLAIVISDGMDEEIESGIKHVAGRGHEILFIQVLSQLELDPDIEGDLRLIDVESGSGVEITASSATLRTYRENVMAHNLLIAETVTAMGGRYHLVGSDESLVSFVQGFLKKSGWVA